MPLVINNTVAFVHIPKTGGTAVRQRLNDHKYKLHEAKPEPCAKGVHANGCWLDMPKFCLVRDPLSWVLSAWGFWIDDDSRRVRHINHGKIIEAKEYNWCACNWSPVLVEAFNKQNFEETLKGIMRLRPGIVSETMSSFADQDNMTTFMFPDFKGVTEYLRKHIVSKPPPEHFKRVNASVIRYTPVDEAVLKDFAAAESAFYEKYDVGQAEAIEEFSKRQKRILDKKTRR